MSGTKLLLDTNIIIKDIIGTYSGIFPIIENNEIAILIISKIEILGYHGISKKEESIIRNFLDVVEIIPLNDLISDIAIDLRRNQKIKTPDSIIAATALSERIPLVTEDKGFDN